MTIDKSPARAFREAGDQMRNSSRYSAPSLSGIGLHAFTWLVEMALFWPVAAAFAVTDHMQTDTSSKAATTTLWRCSFVVLFYAFYLIDICAVLEVA